MWRFVFILVLFMIGCRDDPPHPNQQAIDRAEKHADESAQQLELARQEAKHQQRLRYIDRMTFQAERNDIQASSFIGQAWMLSLAVLLLVCLIWLAREIRLRRVLAHILVNVRHDRLKGGDG